MAGLVKTMEAYKKASLAKSSRRTDRVGLRHYRKFCKSFRDTQFPPTQLTLRLFVTHLTNTMSFKSIKLYLAAVKFKAVELGFGNNFHKMSQLHLLLRGIKRKLGSTGARKPRLPIIPELLTLIKSYIRKKVSSPDLTQPCSGLLAALPSLVFSIAPNILPHQPSHFTKPQLCSSKILRLTILQFISL